MTAVLPLVRTLDLVEGETPASFVSRLAAYHGTIPRELCSDFGMRWPYLCSGQADQLERLAMLTGADAARLKLWAPIKTDIGRYTVGQAVSSVGTFRRTSLRVCPICVREGQAQGGPSAIFQLLEWCVTCLHTCAVHGVALCALPPAAYSHETYDVVTQAMLHHRTIMEAAANAEIIAPSSFENYVRQRIRDGAVGDWLDPLELAHLHRACLTLGLMSEGATDVPWTKVDPLRGREACDIGLAVLQGGAAGLALFLDHLRSRCSGDRPYFSSDMGHFYAWLRTVYEEPALVQLTAAVRHYVFDHYPVQRDQEVLGAYPDQVVRITFDEARRRSGLGVGFLKRLLGHLDGVGSEDALLRNELTVQDLHRVRTFRANLCNLTEASDLLGVQLEQVKALIRLGILDQLKFGTALRYLPRQDVEKLLAGIDALPLHSPRCHTMPIKIFCYSRSIALARVIKAWQDGELHGLLSRGEGQGLQTLRVDPDAFCDRTEVSLVRDLSLADTARYLRISVVAVRKMRDAGILRRVIKQNSDTNFRKGFVTRASIEAFAAQYVTLGQMAVQIGVAPIHLARRLDYDGIDLLEVHGAMVRAYERSVVFTYICRAT